MSDAHILLIEDNLLVGTVVKERLEEAGYEVTLADNGAVAKEAVANQSFQVALCDLQLPDVNGMDLLKEWVEAGLDMRVIMMTAYGEINTAVTAIKLGAYDFLPKPVDNTLLMKTVKNAIDSADLGREIVKLRSIHEHQERQISYEMEGVISGDAMKQTVELAKVVAGSDFSSLFIRGESGTGKGLFAKTIHKIGKRGDKPFVEVNCSALPSTLVESELFGHKKGAFTDAKENKTGLFELADGGTIFLDEIGDMDVSLQAKLLKVIEDQRFRRIGDTQDIEVDVTVIAATHQSVEKLVKEGRFREDLYYRLNVVPLELPPLRKHREDIPDLCTHFINIYAKKFGKPIDGFTPGAMQAMMNYSWPGNVRELRNVVERGCLLCSGTEITEKELLFPKISAPETETPQVAEAPATIPPAEPAAKAPETGGESMAETPLLSLAEGEKMLIERAMQASNGNKNEAARILGVHRTTLYKKLEEYSIS